MGKVYSPEEIKDGHIPEIGAHENAARFLLDELFVHEKATLTTEEENQFSPLGYNNYFSIPAGMVYGSVALGIANRRSDIDLLLHYHDNYATDAFQIMGKLIGFTEAKFHTPIELNALPVSSLASPLEHTIDPLFAQHLYAVELQRDPQWSYGWPARTLHWSMVGLSDRDGVRSIATRYCGGKARQFTRALTDGNNEPIDYKNFQRALELPSAIGRKVLAATHTEALPDSVISGDRNTSMQMLLEKMNSISGSAYERSTDTLKWLIDKDAEYSELLEQAIVSQVRIEAYAKWIQKHYTEACTHAYRLARVWVDILRADLNSRNYSVDCVELSSPDSIDADMY